MNNSPCEALRLFSIRWTLKMKEAMRFQYNNKDWIEANNRVLKWKFSFPAWISHSCDHLCLPGTAVTSIYYIKVSVMSTAACGLFPSVGNPHYKTNLVANYMKFVPQTPKSSSKSQYIFGLSLKLVKQKGIINEGKLVIRSACSILLLKINWLLLCLDVAAGSPWEV